MTSTQPETIALLEDDSFFDAAARGELPETRPGAAADPDSNNGVGAATLPRPPAGPATPHGRRAPKRPSVPQPPTSQRDGPRRLTTGPLANRRLRSAAIAAVATACLVAGAFLVLHQGPRAPSPSDEPRASTAPPLTMTAGRPGGGGLDVLSPRLLPAAGPLAHTDRSTRPRRVDLAAAVGDRGAGVRRVDLFVNGRRFAAARAACRGGCPTAARFRFTLTGLPARPVVLALAAGDAAGNRSLLWQQLLTPPSHRPGLRLTANLGGRATTRLALGAGGAYTVRGRLTTRTGTPLARRRIQLLAISRSASASPRTLASTPTDRTGRWTLARLRARTGVLLVARHATTRSTVASPALRVAVRSPLTAHRSGRRLTGRLAAGAGGVTVVLARRERSTWRAVARTRAGAGGRYRLALPASPRRRLAVFAGASANWPYTPASRLLPKRPR